MSPRAGNILIVDDEAGVRSALAGVLEDEGYGVDAVDSGEAGMEALPAAVVYPPARPDDLNITQRRRTPAEWP